MPQGETFWNPYRWVPVKTDNIRYETPAYRHCWQGLAGRIECTLEALTPFLIGSSKGDGQFIRSGRTNRPFIPGTSLKGLIRSLAELIGNAAIPFPKGDVDRAHVLSRASRGEGEQWQLDIAARMFGHLDGGRVFAGLVRFGDGQLVDSPPKPLTFQVAGGAPRPDHRPFYPDHARRKFYHHHPEAPSLTSPHVGIKPNQIRTVHPLPSGVRFRFSADFENLREEELNLLLYCLVLEEAVTVTLGSQALAPGQTGTIKMTGPMRHKFGACKPQGAGSVKVTIDKMNIRQSAADRYRKNPASVARLWQGSELQGEIQRRIAPLTSRTDDTMEHLRAMLIYTENDPRDTFNYPDYGWFQQDKGKGTPLKPTK